MTSLQGTDKCTGAPAPRLDKGPGVRTTLYIGLSLGLVVFTAGILLAMGRTAI